VLVDPGHVIPVRELGHAGLPKYAA
jgi:hypothetical protein